MNTLNGSPDALGVYLQQGLCEQILLSYSL